MFTGPMTRLRNTGADGLDARFVSQVALLSWRCTSGACRGSVKGSGARFDALPFKYPSFDRQSMPDVVLRGSISGDRSVPITTYWSVSNPEHV